MNKIERDELYRKAKEMMEEFSVTTSDSNNINEDAPYGKIIDINPVGITAAFMSFLSWAMDSGAIDAFSEHLEMNTDPEIANFTRWCLTYSHLEWARIAMTKAENNFLNEMKGLING